MTLENLPFITNNAALQETTRVEQPVQGWGNFMTRAKSQKTSFGIKVKEFGSGCKSWDISRKFTGAAPDKFPHNMLQSIRSSESLNL